MGYLFIGFNPKEDYRILICAFDMEEAQDLARKYGFDAKLKGNFEIIKADSIDNIHFDCDYVVC